MTSKEEGSEKFVFLYKKLGETPLECLLRYKEVSGEKRPMTYAGRLDPLAEGDLLCLIGEECKNKEKYLVLDKIYQFEILVGFNTDTHDLLGVVQRSLRDFRDVTHPGTTDLQLTQALQTFIGKQTQKYPAFSSKTVGGIQLHTLARETKLDISNRDVTHPGTIEIPSRQIEIYEMKLIGSRTIGGKELLKNILYKINLVKGDFRQEQIKEKWGSVLASEVPNNFQIFEIEMSCSSGTYVRGLIRDLGKQMGLPMCAYSIKRTRIGDYFFMDQ